MDGASLRRRVPVRLGQFNATLQSNRNVNYQTVRRVGGLSHSGMHGFDSVCGHDCATSCGLTLYAFSEIFQN